MITIRTTADLARALASPDATLTDLLALRRDQLLTDGEGDLSGLAVFVVVEPGDRPGAVVRALGFDPTVNVTDASRLGEPDFTPSWEWIERHPGWSELTFVFGDDGFAHVLLIPDGDHVDPTLRELRLTPSN